MRSNSWVSFLDAIHLFIFSRKSSHTSLIYLQFSFFNLHRFSTDLIQQSLMPPAIDLKPHQTKILKYVEEKKFTRDIAAILQRDHGVTVSKTKIASTLERWNARIKNSSIIDNESLHNHLRELFWKTLTDAEMSHVLTKDEFKITERSVKKTQLSLELKRWENSAEIQQQEEKRMEEWLKKELAKEAVQKYECQLLHQYVRLNNNTTTRYVCMIINLTYSNDLLFCF